MEARKVIYPLKCKCGFAGDVFARVRDLGPDGRLACPACGSMAEQNYAEKRVANGNREFRSQTQVSIQEGWHPSEVGKVQRVMVANGDTSSANCIDREGRVRFKDRQQQQRYMAAKERIWEQVAAGPSYAPTMNEAARRRAEKVMASRQPVREKRPAREGRGRGNLRRKAA